MPKSRRQSHSYVKGHRKVLWRDQKIKQRRIAITQDFYDLLVMEYGSSRRFRAGLREAGINSCLTFDREVFLDSIYEKFNKEAVRLPYAGKVSRKQFEHLRKSFSTSGRRIICYRTVQRHWRRQTTRPTRVPTATFFQAIESGDRVITSEYEELPNTMPLAISISNKLLWILSLIHGHLVKHIETLSDTLPRAEPESVVLRLDFLLWYDGAKMRGNHKGLFAAIKVVDAYLVIDGQKVLLPDSLLRTLQSIAWVLAVCRGGETRLNVVQLEKELLSQWAEIVSNPAPEFAFVYENIRLDPHLLGFVADHGIRQKSLPLNSIAARCGECTWLFWSDAEYSFLDWERICDVTTCTIANWAVTHFADLPEHLELWEGVESDGFLTYDNHHNIVGFFQDLFDVMMSFVPAGEHTDNVLSQLRELTGVCAKAKPRGSTLPDHRFYRGFHWRLVSLHLKDILAPLWNGKRVSDTFDAIFHLFTEIHVFNYVHWKRDEPEFRNIRARYAMVLYQFTLQLRKAVPKDKIDDLDAMYSHKLFGHSPKVFKRYNLAACSCEQGEGIISVINSLLCHTSGSYEARLRKVFLQLTMLEEQKMEDGLQRDKSVVFSDFFTKYAPPTLSLTLNPREYTGFMKLFHYCDLVTGERPLGVLLHYDRNRQRYHIDCPPDSMEAMLRKSTARDGVPQARIERSTLRLHVFRDRLPTPFIKKPLKKASQPKEPYAILLRKRLASLLHEINDQLDLLSRGVSNYARQAIARVDDIHGSELGRWTGQQGKPSLASKTGLSASRNSWESAFACTEKSKEPTRLKKTRAKEQFENEVLGRPWIQEITQGFVRAIDYLSTVHGDVLRYYAPDVEDVSPDDTSLAHTLIRASVELFDVYCKWNRCLKDIANLFYSVCYSVGRISHATDRADDELSDSDYEDEISDEQSFHDDDTEESDEHEHDIEESEEELFLSDASSNDDECYYMDIEESEEELFDSGNETSED